MLHSEKHFVHEHNTSNMAYIAVPNMQMSIMVQTWTVFFWNHSFVSSASCKTLSGLSIIGTPHGTCSLIPYIEGAVDTALGVVLGTIHFWFPLLGRSRRKQVENSLHVDMMTSAVDKMECTKTSNETPRNDNEIF